MVELFNPINSKLWPADRQDKLGQVYSQLKGLLDGCSIGGCVGGRGYGCPADAYPTSSDFPPKCASCFFEGPRCSPTGTTSCSKDRCQCASGWAGDRCDVRDYGRCEYTWNNFDCEPRPGYTSCAPGLEARKGGYYDGKWGCKCKCAVDDTDWGCGRDRGVQCRNTE
mmetsp:Transcript_33251/g.73547  ORF Transcript_33251/g.73547 Transcript_33251/m.73547 type:complete len:167 (+) Transcript_33251:3-503(+)